MNKVEIPLSKTKLTLTILGAFLLCFLGTLFIITPDKFVSPFLRNPEMVKFIGFIGIVLFSVLGIYGIKKLFDKKVGLTVDENGITDNTNASSIGLIKWNDIIEIKAEQIMSTKFLLIFTKNPNRIIEQASGMKQKILQGNMKMYGTPISIISTTLKYKFDDLNKLLTEKLNEQREKMPNR